MPPDAYADDGQLWGNPLYDWPALQRRRYRWWTERFRRTFELFDLARIDHFRGFVAYWAVPDGRAGRARRALAARARAARCSTPPRASSARCRVIAEDLGVITAPVERLRRELGFPGMVVLQFAFDPDDPRRPAPAGEPRRATASSTRARTTHDTLRGWWDGAATAAARGGARRAIAAARRRRAEPWWSLIRLAYSSPARLAMVQAQDVLGLGSEARMNIPGRATGRGAGGWSRGR